MPPSPLYRSVNTRTHGVRHLSGGDYRHERNKKAVTDSEAIRSPMHGKVRRGRDYTPLFRFLLSRVGCRWDDVYSEAKARLDTTEPIFWMVARTEEDRQEYVCLGESTFFSGLFVDDEGLLQLVNPRLTAKDMTPFCTCCTHTLNGIRFGESGRS